MKILLQDKNFVITNNSLISINSDSVAENGNLVRITQPKLTIIKDITRATIALITLGGVVPKGNPDNIPVSASTIYKKYSINRIKDLTSDNYETIDGGFDPADVNADPDRMLPIDAMRDLEKKGEIYALYDYFYTSSGTGMTVATANTLGASIATELKSANVNGVILTCGDGTATRAGATMCKKIEEVLLKPAVIVTALSPVAKTVGANRIVVGQSIPCPLGNSALSADKELTIREGILQKCLTALTTEVSGPTVFE